MQTEAQLFEQFREFMARRPIERPQGLARDYHGPIDLNYVRPPATEFPKYVYKASKIDARGYVTRLVRSQEEQDGLPKAWLTSPQEIHDLLSPIVAKQYIDPEEAEGDEPEEKDASKKAKQAARDKSN